MEVSSGLIYSGWGNLGIDGRWFSRTGTPLLDFQAGRTRIRLLAMWKGPLLLWFRAACDPKWRSGLGCNSAAEDLVKDCDLNEHEIAKFIGQV